jgi:hypothetical protein
VTDKEPIPWITIQREVVRAIRLYNEGSRFVNCRRMAIAIQQATDKNSKAYPHFQHVTPKTAQLRVTTSLKKLGWTRWNRKASGRPAVYLVPWVSEDPVIVRIQEGRAVKH